MKKIMMAAALLVAGVSFANAEGYNRVAVSFDNTHFGYNKEMKLDQEMDGFGMNGFGINYVHGFGVAENMFVETGLNVDFGWASKKIWEESDEDGTNKEFFKAKNINMQLPVNFVYRIGVGENMWVSPYVGLNFKLNLVSKYRNTWEPLEDGEKDPDWVNVYSDSEKDGMGHKDLTWNRFQMGWHVGCGFQFSKYYLGVQWGTDFIPAYSHKFEDGEKYKVSTSNLKVSLGYTF